MIFIHFICVPVTPVPSYTTVVLGFEVSPRRIEPILWSPACASTSRGQLEVGGVRLRSRACSDASRGSG